MSKLSKYSTDKLIEKYISVQREFCRFAKVEAEMTEKKKTRIYYPFPSLHIAWGVSDIMFGVKGLVLDTKRRNLEEELHKRNIDTQKIYDSIKKEYYPNS